MESGVFRPEDDVEDVEDAADELLDEDTDGGRLIPRCSVALKL